MATIEFERIVGEGTLDKGGYAGQLLNLVMVHLNKAKTDGQLTAAQVGEVYANTINAAIQQAINYELNMEIQEATGAQIRRKTI